MGKVPIMPPDGFYTGGYPQSQIHWRVEKSGQDERSGNEKILSHPAGITGVLAHCADYFFAFRFGAIER